MVNMKKRSVLLIIRYLVIIAIIVAAILYYNSYKKKKNRPDWRTDKPSEGSIRELVTATGSLNPHVLVNVGTEVSGKIEKVYKDFNSIVRKGDMLAKLDTELLETNFESAKGEVVKAKTSSDEAKLDFDLLKELFNKGMSPEYEMKKAEFKHQQAVQTLKNAQLSLQRAQKNLDNAFIKSPIDGVIVSRNVDEGQTVAASLNAPTLFVIANNLEQMQISAAVDEADIGKIGYSLPVEFSVDAYPMERFRGKIKQIRLNPNSEQNVVSYNVIIDAPNPDRKLLPGMTANVTIVIQRKDNVLRIPESATRFRPNKELWELFGLKWDEELMDNMRPGRGMAGMGAKPDSSKKGESSKPESKTSIAKAGGREASGMPDRTQMMRGERGRGGNMPDSIRQKFMQGRGKTDTKPTAGETFQLATGSHRRRSMRPAQVWVLENGVPVSKSITVGLSDGAYVELLDGLDADVELITGVVYKNPKQMTANNPMMQSGPGMGRRF